MTWPIAKATSSRYFEEIFASLVARKYPDRPVNPASKTKVGVTQTLRDLEDNTVLAIASEAMNHG